MIAFWTATSKMPSFAKLETFLLELGAGFSFVARQKRIQLGGDDFYIDLLFYNASSSAWWWWK
jgi:predicted nuclease of restriction endonuclease-like (RecB) superfamily